ncbi:MULTISPECIES: arylamine N-acetyltransferase family protein [unclassified Nitrospina]|uniref:arylamine N-acetyltransferase family protein n=1 Tax=unclassified Nitrospina TaxID=2638683 RepID=UPI003F9DC055
MTPLTHEQLDAYLHRIGHSGPVANDAATLTALHTAHTLNVPFENLDLYLGRAISLEPGALFEKIVTQRRGGWCFEMNGLFVRVLKTLGFEFTLLAARVFDEDDIPGPRSHQLQLVRAGGRDWVVDVGFGGFGLIAPVPLEAETVHKQFAQEFRLVRDPAGGYILQTRLDGKWDSQYVFTLEPSLPRDYEYANFYLSHAPDSIFRQKRVVTRPTENGRLKFSNRELKIWDNGGTRTVHAADDTEYKRLLQDHFRLAIDEGFVDPNR